MRVKQTMTGKCKDCETENVEVAVKGKYVGLCEFCRTRKAKAKSRGKKYTPYKDLTPREKQTLDNMSKAQLLVHQKKRENNEVMEKLTAPLTPTVVPENYYQAKAEQAPITSNTQEKLSISKPINSIADLSDQTDFVSTLRECGCEIPETDLNDVLNILVSTDKLKDMFTTIAKGNSQQALLDLEQALNVVERKLQHNWEFNGFQETDDIKFKNFLKWRRMLKGAIFFWKKLYQTNCIIEMQRAWNAYTQDPNEKILLAGDKIDSAMKRFQITTESISTIFNTRRAFTRIFYATSKESAYEAFLKWMSERQLHENKSKTIITELKNEGEDGRNGDKK